MTDYIDRQAAIDAIERLILPRTKGETAAEEINRVAWRCAINCAEEIIGHLPPIEPVKRGKWIRERRPCIFSQTGSADWITCSVCGERFSTTEVNKEKYCRNCGAKMDAEEVGS